RATDAHPQVVVTDIRMPPTFQREGIDAAKEVRKRHPGTGVVVLSQYDEPEYAISLLSEGAAGYAYLLKDRVAEGDQLARAVREVATGGSMLDPKIVEALVTPVTGGGELSATEEELLRLVAEGRPIKAIAVAQRSEEHTFELQSPDHLVCRLLLEKKKQLASDSGFSRSEAKGSFDGDMDMAQLMPGCERRAGVDYDGGGAATKCGGRVVVMVRITR